MIDFLVHRVPRSWLTWAAAVGVGCALGIAALVISPRLILMGVLGATVLVVSFISPEYIILLVLSLASGLIPAQYNRSVNLVVGHAQISDLLLLWLLGIILLRLVVDKSFQPIFTPLDIPVILFFITVLVGLANATIRFGINFSDATYEARMLMYYLMYFPIVNLIRNRSQLDRFAKGVLIVGILLALKMIGQSSLAGSIVPLDVTPIAGVSSLVRVFNPGFPIVFVSLMILFSYLAVRRVETLPALFWPGLLVLGGALLVTLSRNIVLVISTGGLLLFSMVPDFDRPKFLRATIGPASLALVLLGTMVILGINIGISDYFASFGGRLARMFGPEILSQEETLAPRWQEIKYAWDQITLHPILGIGLNNPYRPLLYEGEPQSLRYFIHNAYIALWLKTGLLGLISFLSFSAAFLWHGFTHWRLVEDDFLRATVLGITVSYLCMAISNLVAPTMVQPLSLSIFGVALGLGEAIIRGTTPINCAVKVDTSRRS